MKKIFLVIVFSSILVFYLSGCKLQEKNIDTFLQSEEGEIAHNTLEKLLKAMQDRDSKTIKKMFGPNVLKKMSKTDDQVNQLINFYNGRIFKSYDDGGGVASGCEFDDGEAKITIDAGYDIVTDQGDLVVGISECVEDTNDSKNVGIRYLYIRKKRDDEESGYVYWGDDEETVGIYIGK